MKGAIYVAYFGNPKVVAQFLLKNTLLVFWSYNLVCLAAKGKDENGLQLKKIEPIFVKLLPCVLKNR